MPAQEAAAQAPEQLLLIALEQLEVSVCIVDARLPDQPLVWVNAAFEATTGYPASHALGRNCRFLSEGLPDQPGKAALRAALATAEPVTAVLLNRRADGTTFFNELTVSPLHDDAGALTHFVALQRDVSAAVHADAERRSLAQRMQGGLVPPALPDVPGLDVAVRYQPGTTSADGAAVSGDFYDLYATSSGVGAPAAWNAAIGDVEGRGPGAAAHTATVRNVLKGIGLGGDSPARSLQLLNSALLDELGDRFVTVALTRLQVRQDRVRATVALGGHPQPVARLSGEATLVGTPGDLLGVLPCAEVTNARTDLIPGDLLVLYTDGITEAGAVADQFGEERLLEVVQDAKGTAAAVADAVLDAVSAHSGPGEDDAALLVLRADGA